MSTFLKVLTILVICSSCVSNKKIVYLQNLEGNVPILEDELITYNQPEYRLQYNDIIDVNIQTLEDFLENGFNLSMQRRMQMGAGGVGDIFYLTGYTVDKNGFIRLPVVGEIHVMDKTLEETREIIEDKLRAYINTEIFVRVKFGGIRYTTLGEFRSPGKYMVLQERMTILEAISNSGDMTPTAKRGEVLLIRQYPEGTKLHRINLKDRQLMNSPFFFIQPNDQLYAEPMRVREIGAGENAVQSFSLLMTSVTAVVLLLNLFAR